MVSTLPAKFRIAGILSETLAPPKMATKPPVSLASASRSPRYSTSLAIKHPKSLGREPMASGTATMDASARCAVPNASVQYASAIPARMLANSGSPFFSPFSKRRFSSNTTSPGCSSPAAATASAEVGNGPGITTGRPSNSDSRSATGPMLRAGSWPSPSAGRGGS